MSNPFYGNYDLNVENKAITMMMTVKRANYPKAMMVFKLGNSVRSKVALFRKCWFSTEVLLVIMMITMIVIML